MRPIRLSCYAKLIGLALLCLAPSAYSQSKHVNQANWKLAERFTPEALRPFVYSSTITPGWINKTDRFWYSWRDSNGQKFWIVDPRSKSKLPLFDSNKMAALLSEVGLKPIDAQTLTIGAITFDEKDENIIRFTVDTVRYEYDRRAETLKKSTVKEPTPAPTPGPGFGGGGGGGGFGQGGGANRDFKNTSPDKKAYVYAMDHNLYYVAVVDGKDQTPIQLTKDGEKDFSFGSRQEQTEQQILNQGTVTDPPSTERRVRANATWSKDSKRFYITRGDSRKVKELFLVNSLSEPRPTLLTYKYAMPGEVNVTTTELFAFDPDKKELMKLPVEKYKDQQLRDLHWQDATSDKFRFARRDRLQRNFELCEMDLTDKKVKVLLAEQVENAFLETQSVRYIKSGEDFIWFSERTGWGHFYLYSNDGKLKNAITSGPFRASDVVEVDDKQRVLWFRAQGREGGENPYYQHLYRVGLDGKGLRLLDSGEGDHNSAVSPTKNFHVDTFSRTDTPSKICLRNGSGENIMELEQMDLSRLLEAGWRMPIAFKVKAADGVNDIYGNMWKPADFDAKKKYPIIANVYPGPQTESVSSTFSATATNQRLAQLGFVVIQIGNRGGNPARSNAYHSFGYYNLRDYGLADKKAGIEQLGQRFPWIDVEKVGIYGHSGGGFMTGAALLLPPYNEFFKVGVSSAGNHDNNVYNQNWSEQHHGLREGTTPPPAGAATGRTQSPDPIADGLQEAWLNDPDAPQFDTGPTKAFSIKVPTNHELAANLKGHLLLVHGDMDNNVHHAGTVRLANALIKANKRFDLMFMPGKPHGFGDMQPYFTDMLMEYFCEHLLGDYYRGSAEMKDKSGGGKRK